MVGSYSYSRSFSATTVESVPPSASNPAGGSKNQVSTTGFPNQEETNPATQEKESGTSVQTQSERNTQNSPQAPPQNNYLYPLIFAFGLYYLIFAR